MRNQSPIRWGICLALLVAAAMVWRQSRPAPGPAEAAAQAPASEVRLAPPVDAGPLLSVPSTLRDFGTAVAPVPADPQFPNRLRNTEATMEQLVRNDRALLLANALIDTGVKTKLMIPDHLKAKEDPGSYIVQSRGVINDSFRAQLTAVGAEVVAYIPNNAYLVRVDAAGAAKLARMTWTRSVLPYEPYYKLQDRLLTLAVKQAPVPMAAQLRLTFFPGELPAAREKVEKLGGRILGEDRSPFGPQLIIQPDKDSLVALAAMAEVQTIEQQGKRVTMTDLTRVTVGVSSNSVTTNNFRGLVGTNVLVSVNDFSVDTNYPGLTNRVIVGLNTAVNDLSGHGTHVATILAGSGDPKPSFTTNFMGSSPSNSFRGMAPAATLYVQNFQGLSDSLLAEYAATYNLLTKLKTNTMISNNSWGYDDSFDYDSSSAIFDAATRDAIPGIPGSQPVLFVFSSGNDGFASDNGLGGLPGSLSAPAAAKNVIAVGASEQLRYITNEVTIVDLQGNTNIVAWWRGTTDSSNQVAAYSGRGNTGLGREGQYGRFKPEVVAPGSMTIAGRSTSWDEIAYYNPTRYIINTFTNLTLASGQTNSFALFVPDFSTNLTIEVRNAGTGINTPGIEIYTNQTNILPSSNPAFLYGNPPLSIPLTQPADYGIWFYDLVNTNGSDVIVDIIETIALTNNVGNLYQVLSNDLNGPLDPYYRFEVGTSMAAPVVSGLLALMQEFFERDLGETNNSPALYKALLINSARTISETYGFETRNILNHQGWGLASLTNAIPLTMDPTLYARTEWPIQYFDQSPTNALATGQTHTRNLVANDIGRPFPLRVTLVWTDPPGNPAASLKLVNDLDLVVTNLDTGEVFFGNDFPSGGVYSSGNTTSTNATSDLVNNVENVYLPGDLGTNYAIAVVAKRVNVNAVTAHTNGIVQDYALVVSSGNLLLTSAFVLDQVPTLSQTNLPTVRYFTSATNSLPFMGQRVGAHPPLITTTNGTNVQWNFYVFTNDSSLPYVSFVTFQPPNLAGDPRYNTYRDPSADVDMYVSLSSDLTNLAPAVVSNCFDNELTTTIAPFSATAGAVSITRGGTEALVVTNSGNQVYYVGIKSEDQKGAEFGFLAVASLEPPFEDDGSNHFTVRFFPVPANIPDGTPEQPAAVQLFGVVPQSIQARRIVATNSITHDLFGDLVGTLEHNGVFATLNNHTFITSTNQGGSITVVYDDSDQGDIAGARVTDGPGTLTSFVGQDAAGAWIFTVIDNAPQFVGQIDSFSLGIDAQDPVADGGSSTTIYGLQQGRSAYAAVNVPAGVVGVTFGLDSTPSAVFSGLYVRKGLIPNGANGVFDYGKEGLTGIFTNYVSVADVPPLTPGRYFVQILNISGPTADFTLTIDFTYDLAAAARQIRLVNADAIVRDDALTRTNTANALITAPGLVAGVRVGVRVDHPRPSDLVLRITSPERSVVLAENRGGIINTNGYGTGIEFSELTYTHFSEGTNLATQLMKFADPTRDRAFVPMVRPQLVATNFLEDTNALVFSSTASGDTNEFWRIIPTGTNSGQFSFYYRFYSLSDQAQIYYTNALVADSGLTNDVFLTSFTVTAAVDVDVVQDEFTVTGHGYIDGDRVSFSGVDLPGGLLNGIAYVVVQSDIFNGTFKVSTTEGGTPVDLTDTGTGTFTVTAWHKLGPIVYSGSDSNIVVVINPGGNSSGGTVYDYDIQLLDDLGAARTFTQPITDQRATKVAVYGTNLYLVGTTLNNATNGIYARFGLPVEATAAQTNQTPYETFNWPAKSGGTRFNGIHVSQANSVYVVGDSFTRTIDSLPPDKESKGIAIRFPVAGFASTVANLGSLWDAQVPSTNSSPLLSYYGVEEMHAVVSTTEAGVEYLYVTGQGEDVAGLPGRLIVAKLDSNGNQMWATPDSVGINSQGRGIALLSNHVYTAGASFTGATPSPYIVKFDQAGARVSEAFSILEGEYRGLYAFEQYLYAVGYVNNGGNIDFIVTKFDANLGVVWSLTYDRLGATDILNGVIAMGDRLFAVGASDNGSSPTDGVLMELYQVDGALVTGTGYNGYTVYDGGATGVDGFYGVATDGSDLYVVGETTRPGRTDTDALIVRYHVKDDYLPEESLDNFIGDVAAGTWRLDVIDTRTNYTGGTTPKLLGWQLQVFLSDTNATTFRLENGTDFTGTLRSGQTNYFVINVPLTSSYATNLLTVVSNAGGGTGISLWYDQASFPTGNEVLLTNITTAGQAVVSSSSTPQLIAGQRYFLAVVNTNINTTNEYTLRVSFDTTATTYLAGGGSKPGSFANLPSTYQTYQFAIPAADNYATFELRDLTGDVEVRLQRGYPATENSYDLLASFSGTNYGSVVIAPTGLMPDVSGFWYALVKSLSGPETTYQVRVMPPNRAPVLEALANVEVAEGSELVVQALASDSDGALNRLTFSLAEGAPAGMTINAATGEIRWVPSESQGPAVYAITVTVTDDGAPVLTAQQTFQVLVGEVNSAPVLQPFSLTATEGVAVVAGFSAVDADLPVNTLTYVLLEGPAGMSVNAANGQISWTPGEAQGGVSFQIRVQVSDNQAPALTATGVYNVLVSESNSAPVFANIATQNLTELSPYVLDNIASDADVPVNALSYRFVGAVPAGMQIVANTGRIVWTPTEVQGPGNYSVTVEVEDNGNPPLSAQKVINFAVAEANLAPVVTAIPAQSVNEAQAWSYQVEASDADLPANTLNYSLTSAPSGMTISASTGLISWTPTEAQGPGTYNVTVTVGDNGSPSRAATRTLSITVNEVNAIPVLNAIADVTVDEQTSLILQAVASDSDVPAQTLTYKFTGTVPAGLTIGSSSGTINWSPSEAQGPASYPVTVEVSDGTATASRSFTITVNEVNLAPTLGVIPNVTVTEGQAVRLVAVGNDADNPAQTLTYSLEAGAASGAHIDPNTGAFEWVTAEGAPSNNSLTITVTDNGVPPLSASRTFTITVNEVVTNVVDLVSGVAVTNETRYADSIVADIYRLNVTGQPGKLLFEAFNLSGNGDLLVRRGAYPTPTLYDHRSNLTETNREQVVVTTNETVMDLSGEWFATVINRETTNITYSISGTVPVAVAGGAMLVSTEGIMVETPVFSPGDDAPEFSWTAVAGEKYQVEVTTDLVNWTPLTNIVVSGVTATFTDPTPYTDSALRFYRIRQLPQ